MIHFPHPQAVSGSYIHIPRATCPQPAWARIGQKRLCPPNLKDLCSGHTKMQRGRWWLLLNLFLLLQAPSSVVEVISKGPKGLVSILLSFSFLFFSLIGADINDWTLKSNCIYEENEKVFENKKTRTRDCGYLGKTQSQKDLRRSKVYAVGWSLAQR